MASDNFGVTVSPDWSSAAGPWGAAMSSAPCLASCSSSQADKSGLASCTAAFLSSKSILASDASTVTDGSGLTQAFISNNDASFTVLSCICKQATAFSPFLNGTTTDVCTKYCTASDATAVANVASAYSVLCKSVLNYTPASTTRSTAGTTSETISSGTGSGTTTNSGGATTTSSSSAPSKTGGSGNGSGGVSSKGVTLTGVLLGALLGAIVVM